MNITLKSMDTRSVTVADELEKIWQSAVDAYHSELPDKPTWACTPQETKRARVAAGLAAFKQVAKSAEIIDKL